VYNEVILVKIWHHHIYLWNYTRYLLVHQQFAFSDAGKDTPDEMTGEQSNQGSSLRYIFDCQNTQPEADVS
jgi:hypothetical protein